MKMNMAQKILLIIGGAFAGIGAVLTMIFGSIGMVFRPMRAFLALPRAVFPDTGHLFYRSSIIRAA